MTRSIRQALEILDGATRRRLPWLLGSFGVVAVLDALSIGLVFPVVLAITEPTRAMETPILRSGAAILGSSDSTQFVLALALATACLFLAKNVISALLVRWQFRMLFAAEADVGVRLYKRYLTTPWETVSDRNSSELIRNASVSASHAFLSVIIPGMTIAVEGVLVLAVLAMLVIASPMVALVSFLVIGIASFAYYAVVRRRLTQLGREFQQANFDLLNHLKQGIGSGRELRILGRTEEFVRQMRSARDLYASAQSRRAFLTQLPRYYLELLVVLTVLASVATAFASGSVEQIAPLMALFGVAALRLMASASRVLSAAQQVRTGLEPLAAVHRDLCTTSEENTASDRPAETAGEEAGPDLASTRVSGISVRSVTFQYRDDAPALDNVDISIPWGASIGIIGPSGSGKSTLIDILLGLRLPQEGAVEVDGIDIRRDLGRWRSRIGYVPQSVFLTDDTIRRNVAFGLSEETIDDKAVQHALRLANLESFVASLPSGVQTVVGEHGAALSGGQRQRIGIARALYHNPDVLLLDEATSALDNEAENFVIEAVDALRGSKTVVVVAHRLSTVRRCDWLVMLEGGRVLDTGSFDELLQKNPRFVRSVELGIQGTNSPVRQHQASV